MVLVLFVLSFVLCLGFILIGRIVNWYSGRQWLNGAAIHFWLVLAFGIGLTVFSFVDGRVSLQGHRIIGQATAALIPSLLVSFFVGRRFRHKVRAAKEIRSES